MKTLLKRGALACAFITPLAFANSFVGTWQIVSGEIADKDGNMVQYQEHNLHSIKVINDSHFSFVTMSGDKFWSSGAGSYRFDGELYIEAPVNTSYNSPKGKEYVFKYRFDGDTWYNERWENGKRVEFETWQRVK